MTLIAFVIALYWAIKNNSFYMWVLVFIIAFCLQDK